MSSGGVVVDTLGAGDTFNGAVIGCLSRGAGVRESVEVGCRVAGEKVGRRGLAGIGKVVKDFLPWARK